VPALEASLAAGDDKATVAGMANTVANRIRQAYATSKNPDEAKKALAVLDFAEKASPSPQTAFLKGVINLLLAQNLLQEANSEQSCDKTKEVGGYLTEAQINLPQGASAFPDQAKTLREGMMQLAQYQGQMEKAYCR